MSLNAGLISKKTRQHQLRTVANGVDSRVFNDKTLVRHEQRFQRLDDLAQQRLVSSVIVQPLGILYIVQRDQASIRLGHDTAAHTAKLLHVRANAKEQSQVDTERSDIGTGLARDPEDTEVAVIVELDELALVDRPDTKLALDGRDEGGSLEESTCEGLEGLSDSGLTSLDSAVESDDTDVLLAGTLLGLYESRGAVNADNCLWIVSLGRKSAEVVATVTYSSIR